MFNKRSLSLVALALALCAGASGAALAQVTVNVTGMLTSVSCAHSISGPGVSGNTVTMPTIPVDLLNAAGKTAGDRVLTVSVKNCTTQGINNMWVYFTSPNTLEGGRIVPATRPSNQLLLELLNNNASGSLVHVGGTAGLQPNANQGTAAALSGNNPSRSADKSYVLRYYAKGAITSGGNVSAQLTYNIRYY